MALMKVFRGVKEDLDNVALHDGYVYFIPDEAALYIDVDDRRIRVAADLNETISNLEQQEFNDLRDLLEITQPVAYQISIETGDWIPDENGIYSYFYENDNIRCGLSGDVPPIINCLSGKGTYSVIDYADAIVKDEDNPNGGIRFFLKDGKSPKDDVQLIVVDFE